ncbi:flagellar motor switch protein FliN [Lacrimispora sp.]|uniref:flagellar motor switch protein FliN n=1 Tax=Lacrimispora sp. TaxID=2719234 RepID=UPI0029E08799|nr:flagellar motor switch protein FliN [Lacrimispora sp.]
MDSKNFSAFEIDAIGEILNISLGASATAVSTMLNARVDITTPVVRVLTKSEFEISNLEPAVGVEITYIAGLSGSNIMLLKKHDVKVIVDMLMGTETPEEDFELNELNISAICEVMNQMMGASATALSEFLSKTVNISTPTSFEIEDVGDFKEKYYHDEDLMVVVGFNLKIADQMASEFINVMPPALAKELVAGFFPQESGEPVEETIPEEAPEPDSSPAPSGGLLSQEEIEKLLAGSSEPDPQPQPELKPEPKTPPKQESAGGILSQEEIEMLLNGSMAADTAPAPEPAPAPAPQPAVTAPKTAGQMENTDNSAIQQMMNQMQMQQQMINQMQQMILQMQNSQMNIPKKDAPEPKTINVKPVPQNILTEGQLSFEEQEENRELIMGVPLEVSVEIGRTRKLVKEILEFTKGSLVILDKLAGEQVDLYVNGRCIAKGDVVVVDDNFGIRVTEIIKKNIE